MRLTLSAINFFFRRVSAKVIINLSFIQDSVERGPQIFQTIVKFHGLLSSCAVVKVENQR